MSVKFLSKEWMDANKSGIHAVFNTPSRVDAALIEVFENCPDGSTVWIKLVLEKGILTLFEHGIGKDTIPKATFKVFADYSEYVPIFKGEKEPQTALMTNAFKLEGNLMSALAQMGTYKKLVKIRREIDTEY